MIKTFLLFNIIAINFLNAGEIHKFYLGESTKVVEKDILEQIIEHIHSNSDSIEKKLQNINAKAKSNIENYKNDYKLPFVTKDETIKSDLRYIVTDKDIALNIPLGSVVYPLRHTRLPYTIYLINGEDKAELEWIKRQNYKNIKSRIWITSGSLKNLKDELQVPIYFYSEKIQERFEAKGTPAIIFQDGDELIFKYHKIER